MKKRPLSPKSQALKDQMLKDLARYKDEPHLQPAPTEVNRITELVDDNVRLQKENNFLWVAVAVLGATIVVGLVLEAIL